MHESVGQIWHLKNFYCPNSLGTSWDAKNILKKFFILLSFWDTAVCLHFLAKFKMAASGPKSVTVKFFELSYYQIFFILLSFWDTAVCLHFWAKFKMAARGPKRVTSQVFWSLLLPNFFFNQTTRYRNTTNVAYNYNITIRANILYAMPFSELSWYFFCFPQNSILFFINSYFFELCSNLKR